MNSGTPIIRIVRVAAVQEEAALSVRVEYVMEQVNAIFAMVRDIILP